MMKKLFFALTLGLFVQSASVLADDYLMWQLPSTKISLPVYVYEGGKQVAFIPSDSLQYFAGKYKAGSTNATYDLYYQTGEQWNGCTLVLKDGSVDNTKGITTCTGAVINPPGAKSNVYTTGFGAYAWSSVEAPSNPLATDYTNRKVKLVNNTTYPLIQVGESCSVKVGSNKAPSCQTNPIIATIANKSPNNTHVITVDKDGLNSSAFYMSAYCTASSVKKCGTSPTKAQCEKGTQGKTWVCTGGYFAGQTPYASKIEPTILTVTNGIPDGASNIDISAVDGYNTTVKLYPEQGAYCTYTVPPENSNVLGAGYYDTATPLAEINPPNGLEALCDSSSQLPAKYSGTISQWKLTKMDSAKKFEGCMSPCAYASKHKPKDKDRFCCTGSFDTPAACDAAAGDIGANTATYNSNVVSTFTHVYGFAYGDAGSDYACPPETNFIVEFVAP
ncbi:Uncharacterised protein [BD1-7 clade bacterium]|uniref:Thaumatin domain-containing protein n=1 Tax=BD1-7 clade bacterium TaxID=2029982 RepID=A0A5S9P5Z2_9GAMM|nr:Uncharacterised protein [BD1-7 clade bacterium]